MFSRRSSFYGGRRAGGGARRQSANIQKRGLSQQGQVPSDCPVYYYVHFLGHWSSEGGIRKRGPLPAEAQALTRRLAEALTSSLGAPLLERTSLFYQLSHPFVPQPPSNPCGTAGGKRPAAVAVPLEGRRVSRPNRRRAARQRELSNPHFPPPVSDHAPPLPDASSSGTGSRPTRYSDLSLEAISLECGFRSYANFYKAFCAEKGENPAAVLKRLR